MEKSELAHLDPSTAAWVQEIFSEFELERHKVKILIQAGGTLDRINAAREVIDREGAFYTDKEGRPRKHPALDAERNDRVVFARLLRELNLSEEAPDPRPPALRYR